MSCSKLNNKRLNKNIKKEPIKQVQSYCYLGSQITKESRSKLDILHKIAQKKKNLSK